MPTPFDDDALAGVLGHMNRDHADDNLLIARAFVGIGEASYATLAPTIIDDIPPPDRKGKALAIFFISIYAWQISEESRQLVNALAATELDLARAEFGDARVRDLAQALDHSQRTLNRAFELRQRIDDGPSLPDAERRGMLLEIISTCGTADDRLDAEVARYAEMREQLLNAPDTLDHLTQRAIDLRTRIPQAATVLDGMRARYDETMLASISDNIDMATEHVNMAEQTRDEARSLLSKPAG